MREKKIKSAAGAGGCKISEVEDELEVLLERAGVDDCESLPLQQFKQDGVIIMLLREKIKREEKQRTLLKEKAE